MRAAARRSVVRPGVRPDGHLTFTFPLGEGVTHRVTDEGLFVTSLLSSPHRTARLTCGARHTQHFKEETL